MKTNITNQIANSRSIKLFDNLLQSSVQVHIFHFQTKSYAQHMALGSFYEDIVDLTDDLIEQYQGKYGVINTYNTITLVTTTDYINYFKTLRLLVEGTRYSELKKEDTHLQNIIDEIVSLIDKTLYKLINLH